MLILSSFILLETFAQGIIKGIQENIRNKQVTPFGAMHTTGQAENSLFYRLDANRLIIGSTWAYITVLEDGRKPGKFAPPEVIEKWIENKPIAHSGNSDFGDAISKESLAYLINKKLKEEGSLLWQKGGNSGILSQYINQEYVHNNLTPEFAKGLAKDISSILFKQQVA
jgi:hypothetical protein